MATCTTCWLEFEGPTDARFTTCPACLMKAENAPTPSLRPRANWKLLGTVVLGSIAVIGCLAIYFYIRGHSGIIGEIRGYADRMCECQDAKCVETVDAEFEAWVSSSQDDRVTRFEGMDIKEQAERIESCARRVLARD